MFRPILVDADLPLVGKVYETFQIDFKSAVDTADVFEMAKDIAAFANTSGGTLIACAAQDGREGPLKCYLPKPRSEAETLGRHYVSAAVDRCSPSPVVEPAVLQSPDGSGHVLAINVSPFPAQPVGARRGRRGDKDGVAFVFPFKVGSHTRYLEPEQLPMIMLPELRRTAILLDGIPPSERSRVRLCSAADPTGTEFQYAEVEVLTNSVLLKSLRQSGSMRVGDPFNLPLDAIKSVWKAQSEWFVLIQGRTVVLADRWTYVPE